MNNLAWMDSSVDEDCCLYLTSQVDWSDWMPVIDASVVRVTLLGRVLERYYIAWLMSITQVDGE